MTRPSGEKTISGHDRGGSGALRRLVADSSQLWNMEKAKAYLQTRGSKVNFLHEGIGPDGSTLRPGHGSRQMCSTDKYGFPIRHRTHNKTFMGFRTGDMAHANIPKGKFAGRHFGRITIRQRKSLIIWVRREPRPPYRSNFGLAPNNETSRHDTLLDKLREPNLIK
jgi:hypothetical protein